MKQWGVTIVLALGLIAAVHAQTGAATTSAQATAVKQAVPSGAASGTLGIGRAASADEIRALDIDVMPDGRGLPAGRGTVAEGAAVYAAKCASCHGAKGQGGQAERLVGREGNVKTVGNYWPYATTLYDYTFRSMPFMQPGSLTPNETYGLVAFILHLNEIVPESAVMDQTALPKVVMPAKDKFVLDNRTGGKVVK